MRIMSENPDFLKELLSENPARFRDAGIFDNI